MYCEYSRTGPVLGPNHRYTAVYHAVKCRDKLEMYFLYLEGMSDKLQVLENKMHKKIFVLKGIKKMASGGHSTVRKFTICTVLLLLG